MKAAGRMRRGAGSWFLALVLPTLAGVLLWGCEARRDAAVGAGIPSRSESPAASDPPSSGGSATRAASLPTEGPDEARRKDPPMEGTKEGDRIVRTEEEWKRILTPEEFRICREKGTERAFTGAYWNEHRDGRYFCAGCGQELFLSQNKFDSGTGWPSFWKPAGESSVGTEEDRGWFTTRTEVHCSRCGSHLGHVFDDGPQPTGLRYCINSAALRFVASGEAPASK